MKTLTMTFEEFQATKTFCPDLAKATGSDSWEEGGTPRGWLYLNMLYIEEVAEHWNEKARAAGKYYLLLGRCDWLTNDLESLERKLYEWAISEGYVEGAST